MDLIGMLGSQLGLGGDQAQALAGTVLGGVKDAVGEQFGGDAANKIGSAVPELGDWQAKASQFLGAGEEKQEEGGGGLMGALSGALGGGGGGGGGLLAGAMGALTGDKNIGAMAGLLNKFGVDPGKAGLAAGPIVQFLESRVDKGLLDKVMSAAPFLAGALGGGGGDAAGGGGAAGIMGAIGGMLGGKD